MAMIARGGRADMTVRRRTDVKERKLGARAAAQTQWEARRSVLSPRRCRDVLDEMIEESTRENPRFPQILEAAHEQRRRRRAAAAKTRRAAAGTARGLDARKYLERLVGPLTLGKALRATREGEGMSQSAFAAHLGISRTYLRDIELGRKDVELARAAEFARTLGYSETQYVRLAIQDELTRAGLHMHVDIRAA
jgi:DNA-binding transcriptional regulator YiaG